MAPIITHYVFSEDRCFPLFRLEDKHTITPPGDAFKSCGNFKVNPMQSSLFPDTL